MAPPEPSAAARARAPARRPSRPRAGAPRRAPWRRRSRPSQPAAACVSRASRTGAPAAAEARAAAARPRGRPQSALPVWAAGSPLQPRLPSQRRARGWRGGHSSLFSTGSPACVFGGLAVAVCPSSLVLCMVTETIGGHRVGFVFPFYSLWGQAVHLVVLAFLPRVNCARSLIGIHS